MTAILFACDGSAGFPARAGHLDPEAAFKSRAGFSVHQTFSERVLPVLCPVERVEEGHFAVSNLGRYCDVHKKHPNSAEIFEHLDPPQFISWEHLVTLVGWQPDGRAGILVTTNNAATLCFMKGVAHLVFLIRISWHPSLVTWHIRAWGLDERINKGWYPGNQVLYLTCP